eukprot:COSAG02_NODE_5342_length_4415_cov_3.398285_5_plen_210_part_00
MEMERERLDARIERARKENSMSPGDQDYEHLVRKCIRENKERTETPPSSPTSSTSAGEWSPPPESPCSSGQLSGLTWTSEEEEDCEIKKIVARKKVERGDWKYRVRWYGYGATEDLWYTREQLCEGAREMVEDFDRHQDELELGDDLVAMFRSYELEAMAIWIPPDISGFLHWQKMLFVFSIFCQPSQRGPREYYATPGALVPKLAKLG